MKIEQKQLDEIIQLCASNRVKSLSAFGSVTREDFNDKSDIDLLVDFEEEDPYKYTDLYFNLKTKLEHLLKRNVDLVEERGIKNRFFRRQVEKSKIQIYGL
uniref:nucleotidyltransferase family protein n=1 Tax=Roseivirga sp. TaxID=1964215 RepID=UPI004047EA90